MIIFWLIGELILTHFDFQKNYFDILIENLNKLEIKWHRSWKRNITFDELHFDYRTIKTHICWYNELFSSKNPVYNKQTETYRGRLSTIIILKWLFLVAFSFFGVTSYIINTLSWYWKQLYFVCDPLDATNAAKLLIDQLEERNFTD